MPYLEQKYIIYADELKYYDKGQKPDIYVVEANFGWNVFYKTYGKWTHVKWFNTSAKNAILYAQALVKKLNMKHAMTGVEFEPLTEEEEKQALAEEDSTTRIKPD